PLPPLARGRDVAAIEREIAVPPQFPSKNANSPAGAFPAAALKGYEADVSFEEIRKPENAKNYPLRIAVLDAFGMIRDLWKQDWLVLRTEFSGPTTFEVKKEIAEEQLVPARAIARLELS